jgi:signal transduction histidine kinase
MRAIDYSALADTLPRLRANFEASRALVERVRARASSATRQAEAMRQLLQSRRTLPRHGAPVDRDIWDAAAAEVLRAATERDRALGMLAHELRQPLAAAVAAHRLLSMQPESTVAERASTVLDRQLQHLSDLVERLLDFSRVSLGSLSLDRQDLDLRDILGRAIETAQTAETAHHNLSLALTASPAIVCGDGTRLLQVFSNLLHNAVRYTPKGGTVVLSVTADDEAARVTVRDSGRGIPSELQPQIFEPFLRGARDGKGLGIGLALARSIVEMHGGRIEVFSEGAGRGTTFTVTLPLAPTGPRTAAVP